MFWRHHRANDDPILAYRQAVQLVRRGEYAKAIQLFEQAVRLDPENLDPEVYAHAGWLLATCPDRSLRNGKKAVELAKKACDLTENEPQPLSVLAAAYAEQGDFERAIAFQLAAIKGYEQGEYDWLTASYWQTCKDRLETYKSHQSMEWNPDP